MGLEPFKQRLKHRPFVNRGINDKMTIRRSFEVVEDADLVVAHLWVQRRAERSPLHCRQE